MAFKINIKARFKVAIYSLPKFTIINFDIITKIFFTNF